MEMAQHYTTSRRHFIFQYFHARRVSAAACSLLEVSQREQRLANGCGSGCRRTEKKRGNVDEGKP